ncbi:MAG: hypothetical protein LUE27_11045 [Clostridia bacterium]|nr:hypothetical protein [Clostridia bacterium]
MSRFESFTDGEVETLWKGTDELMEVCKDHTPELHLWVELHEELDRRGMTKEHDDAIIANLAGTNRRKVDEQI